MSTLANICIIGGGWYGCHIAKVLMEEEGSKYNVTLFEKNDRLMQGASGYNTFRLHCGPHYPRDQETRQQVNEAFHRFTETYPSFVIDQHKAWYAIGDVDSDGNKSLVDAKEFQRICKETDPNFTIDEPATNGIAHVSTLCSVNEKTINVDEPEIYFQNKLKELGVTLNLGVEVTKLEKSTTSHCILVEVTDGSNRIKKKLFDFVVNCTYYTDFVALNDKLFYEPCASFYYKPKINTLKKNLISLSVFDGMFPSLDPYVTKRHKNDVIKSDVIAYGDDDDDDDDDVLYLLTHAKYTPLGQFKSIREANSYLKLVDETVIENRRHLIDAHFTRFYIKFHEHFEYVGKFLSIKTKIVSETSFRGTLVLKEADENVLHILSGKVSTIFQAGDTIQQYLEKLF